MKQSSTCPRCGAKLEQDAPGGLCPRCLVAMNLATETVGPGQGGPVGEAGQGSLPDLEQLGRLFPQLELLELLGRGGMGLVLKARQKQLNRLVALKILSEKYQADPAFEERFSREAQTLARLNHPGIVTIYDFGKADGHYYLLMEYVDGVNLRGLLSEGRLSPEQALTIVPAICEALQYAHEQGVVHRDIKPENILLDATGRVKIADFGIAKIVGEKGRGALTGAQDVVGTPHYMAPEQVEQPRQVDHRADIYSLGVVFYEMLTGELPLGRFAPPSRKVQVDVRLDEIVLHALEKEPDRRYQQVREVQTDVQTVVQSGPGGAQGSPGQAGRGKVAAEARGGLVAEVAQWTARVVSTLMMLLYGVFIVGEGLPAIGSQPGGVRLGFIALAVCFTGFFIGWRREGWGALVIAIGWGLWQVSEAVFKLSLFQVPLLVAALYGFYWWITAGRRTWVLAGATCALGLGIALGLLLVPANVFLSGAVLDGATGEPVPGAEFVLGATTAPSPGRRPAARSGLDGKYRLYIGWYSPQQAVSISAPGFETRESVLGSRLLGQRRIARDYRLKRAVASVPSAEFRETPPVVIKTFPESGISGVDPALSELRVTFSKPMQAGFWSWCPEHESTAPAICGDPKYLADERTCVLPVRLAGGKAYAVWLNIESNHLFRDQNGNVAVPYLLIFETRK